MPVRVRTLLHFPHVDLPHTLGVQLGFNSCTFKNLTQTSSTMDHRSPEAKSPRVWGLPLSTPKKSQVEFSDFRRDFRPRRVPRTLHKLAEHIDDHSSGLVAPPDGRPTVDRRSRTAGLSGPAQLH